MSNAIMPHEAPQAPALTLAEALEEYRLAVEAAGRFRMAYAAVLNELELREAVVAEAKEAITALMVENKIKPSLRITTKDGKNG
ncbi:hypothetical protein [Nitrolancea hollandica]|nr:hypothetical protein [Nitrolancea hollandica]